MSDEIENIEFSGDNGELEVIYSDEEYEEISHIGNDDIEADIIIDKATLTFVKHTKSVFSSALSNDGKLAVTGGEDDIAYVWNPNNGEVLLECTGHKDSVTEVCFNMDSQYVATGDMGANH